jgi:hypothetical protein
MMSNALAIASVTRVLKDLLNNGLVDHDISGAVGGNVSVTALSPDRVIVQPDGNEANQLNIFMHQVRPNAGWRNTELPNRNANGERVGNPLLALNLHYLVTAYGADELNGEILLGYAMQLLHENPVLSRQAIRTALANPAVNGSILPPAFQAASASDLANQLELIKITPDQLTTDDMSKIWTALQAHYRPTAAYEVSVVLIEGRRPAMSPLPVLQRGQIDPATGREAGVVVQAGMLPPYPTLELLTPDKMQTAARMGETITLDGHHLAGDQILVRFTEPRSRRSLELPAAAGATDTKLTVQMPPDPPLAPLPANSPLHPDNWQPGVYGVLVVIKRAGKPDRTTNEVPMMLAPRLSNIAAVKAADIVTFTVKTSPKVRQTQRVSLIVGDREIAADPIAVPQTDALSFKASGFVSGIDQWLRLRVDGAESILVDRSASPPAFVASQKVTIP